jgi:hypothetical protein
MPPCKNSSIGYYTGKEPSPKGLGYCAHSEGVGKRRIGNDGDMWIVQQDRIGRLAWKKVGTSGTPKKRKTPGTPKKRKTPGTPKKRKTPGTPKKRKTPGTPKKRKTPGTPKSTDDSDYERTTWVLFGKDDSDYDGRTTWVPTHTRYSINRNMFTVTVRDKIPANARILGTVMSALRYEIPFTIDHEKYPLALKSITRQGQKIVITFQQKDNAYLKLREMSDKELKTMVDVLSNDLYMDVR